MLIGSSSPFSGIVIVVISIHGGSIPSSVLGVTSLPWNGYFHARMLQSAFLV